MEFFLSVPATLTLFIDRLSLSLLWRIHGKDVVQGCERASCLAIASLCACVSAAASQPLSLSMRQERLKGEEEREADRTRHAAGESG